MQPYLFPYLGYFQLINSVDFFGIGDDVQYIKGGWINRNRYFTKNGAYTFSFSIAADSHRKIISERYYHDNFALESEKFLRFLKIHYKKAQYFSSTIKIVEEILGFKDRSVSFFNVNQLQVLCNYFEVKTKFINSSEWETNSVSDLSTQERVINKLNKLDYLSINHFINPVGGTEIYKKQYFEERNYKLSFLKSGEILYTQFSDSFLPNLSIIDVMMFNHPLKIKEMLSKYTLE